MQEIVNLTPHEVVVITDEGKFIFPPSGEVARCTERAKKVGEINGISLVSVKFGDVTGLPEKVEGRFLIVSAQVRSALPFRNDLVSPHGFVRDEAGNIIGCTALAANKNAHWNKEEEN